MSAGTMADRLRSALPQESADQVFQEIEAARARRLPAGALEHRALTSAAKGVDGAAIVREIAGYHRALWIGREVLRAGDRAEPTDAEVEAAGGALEKGIDDVALNALVHAAPPERPLAVPLLVVSSLLDRGLPAADVVSAMQVWLTGHASDDELRDLAGPLRGPELTVIRTRTTGPH